MGVQFAWFYDVLLVAVIIACVAIGYKKGLVRTIVMLCGYIIAIFAGFFVASNYSSPAYNKFVSPKVENYVEKSIGDFNIDKELNDILKDKNINVKLTDEEIDNIMQSNDNFSDGVINYIENKGVALSQTQKEEISNAYSSDNILKSIEGKINPKAYTILSTFNSLTDNAMNKFLKALTGDTQRQTAKQLSDAVIKPVAINIIKAILFLLTFVIVSILVRLLGRFLSFVNKIPLAGTANRILGGVLGFVQGTLYVFVFSLLLKISIAVTSSEMLWLNEKTINATKLFRLFYNIDLFK